MPDVRRWVPGTMLALGAVFTLGVDRQKQVPLAMPLSTVPSEIAGFRGVDLTISEAEQQVAAFTSYLYRAYTTDSIAAFQVYVAYYDHQTQGKTIHTPKNCLPGSGWEALEQSTVRVPLADGDATVNRYVLQNERQRVLVFYWYQGRGRVAANEYRVKWELLRDSALRGRSEEALVRIVVPLTEARNEAAAEALAVEVAGSLIPAVEQALPE